MVMVIDGRFFKKNGSGLVQVMVVAAIMGFLMVVGSQMMTNLSKGTKTTQLNTNQIEIENAIRLATSNPSLCLAALGGTGQNATSELNFNIMGTNYQQNTIIEGIRITSLKLSNVAPLPPQTFVSALRLQVAKVVTETSLGWQTKTRDIPFLVSTDAANNIISCTSSADPGAMQYLAQSTPLHNITDWNPQLNTWVSFPLPPNIPTNATNLLVSTTCGQTAVYTSGVAGGTGFTTHAQHIAAGISFICNAHSNNVNSASTTFVPVVNGQVWFLVDKCNGGACGGAGFRANALGFRY